MNTLSPTELEDHIQDSNNNYTHVNSNKRKKLTVFLVGAIIVIVIIVVSYICLHSATNSTNFLPPRIPFEFTGKPPKIVEVDINVASMEAMMGNLGVIDNKIINGHYLYLFGDGNDPTIPSYLIYDGKIVFKGNVSSIILSKNGQLYGFTTSISDSNYNSSHGALYINGEKEVTSKYDLAIGDLENNGAYVYTEEQASCDGVFCHPPTNLYTSTGKLIQQFSENEVTVNQVSTDLSNIYYTFNENTTFGMSTNVFDDYLNGKLLRHDSNTFDTFSDNFQHNVTATQVTNGTSPCGVNLYKDGQVMGKTSKFNGVTMSGSGDYDGTSPEINNAGQYAYVDPNDCKGGYTVYLQSKFIRISDKNAVAIYFNPEQTHLLVGSGANQGNNITYSAYTWQLDGQPVTLPFIGNNNTIELDDNALYIYNMQGGQ